MGQEYDNNWIVGYNERYDLSKVYQGHTLLAFKDNLNVKFLDANMPKCALSFTTACISNQEGELIFFTDGNRIYGDKYELIENGDTINPGRMWGPSLSHGYPQVNGAYFLPYPGLSDMYVLFHKSASFINNFYIKGRSDARFCDKFYYSILQYDKNKSTVIQKNIILLESNPQDSTSILINESEIAACKHGNGKDYWLVIKLMGEPEYYFYLLDSSGVKLSHKQKIGMARTRNDWNGNSVFSMDGSRFARVLPEDGLEVFDFDRCKGLFKNPQHVIFPDTNLIVSSVAFSSSRRFLYMSSVNKIWQYDLASSNLKNSEVEVLSRDTITSPLDNRLYNKGYFQMRLAPDGMIYVANFGGTHFMTRIRQPEMQGRSCEAVNYDILLPAWMAGSLPMFPNFKLGVLKGSDCDQANLVEDISYDEYKVFDQLSIYQLDGKLINEYSDISIHNLRSKCALSTGIYLVRVYDKNKNSKAFKLFIQ